jgi:uncharacterized protein YukE
VFITKGNEVTQEKLLKELEKVKERLSETINRLKNNKITFEEADAVIGECKETLVNFARELKNIEKKIKE